MTEVGYVVSASEAGGQNGSGSMLMGGVRSLRQDRSKEAFVHARVDLFCNCDSQSASASQQVRTAFDAVNPGMPPALQLGTRGAGLVGQVTSGVSRTTMPTLSQRGALKELNDRRRFRRMRRVVIGAADASRDLVQRGGSRFDAIFVTLTYRQEEFYTTRDVSGYIKATREWLQRRKIKAFYQWVIELTKKGKPHYHVLWWVPKGLKLPKPDAEGMWQKGWSRIELATRPVGYLVKYVSKGGDAGGAEIPKGARLFGVGAQDEAVKLARHRFGLPTWLYEATDSTSRCVRVVRIGWVEKQTGVIHDTPYTFGVTRDDWGFIVVTIGEKVKVNAH